MKQNIYKYKEVNMNKSDFIALCGKHLIDVGIALENEELIKLLQDKENYKTIENFLIENFWNEEQSSIHIFNSYLFTSYYNIWPMGF